MSVFEVLVTDRYSQIGKWVAENYQHICLLYGIWHVAKCQRNKMQGKFRRNRPLYKTFHYVPPPPRSGNSVGQLYFKSYGWLRSHVSYSRANKTDHTDVSLPINLLEVNLGCIHSVRHMVSEVGLENNIKRTMSMLHPPEKFIFTTCQNGRLGAPESHTLGWPQS